MSYVLVRQCLIAALSKTSVLYKIHKMSTGIQSMCLYILEETPANQIRFKPQTLLLGVNSETPCLPDSDSKMQVLSKKMC